MGCFVRGNQEDKYLLHLAGEKNGTSPLGWWDKRNASASQKHPTLNKIGAVINGAFGSVGLIGIGSFAYPMLNADLRNGILGDVGSVCKACFSSGKTLTDISLKIDELLNMFRRDPNHPVAYTAASYVFPNVGGTATAGICALDATFNPKQEIVSECRWANYATGVYNTVVDNLPMLVATGVVLAGGLAIYSKNSYEKTEVDTEKQLIAKLQRRYKKIADRLTERAQEAEGDKEKEAEVRQLAEKILKRQGFIAQEVDNLKLPSFSHPMEAEYLVDPVLDAAQKIQRKAS